MGPRLKLPPYVHAFVDRHGKARHYFRRSGFKRVPLPGLPYSSEFMEAYGLAKEGQPAQVGSSRARPGTISALVVAYYNSAEFKHGLAAESAGSVAILWSISASNMATSLWPYCSASTCITCSPRSTGLLQKGIGSKLFEL